MEKELFDWDGWDGDPECMTFYKVVLKKPIGEHPIGAEFSCATILMEQGIVQLYDEAGSLVDEYRLYFTVGERVEKKKKAKK